MSSLFLRPPHLTFLCQNWPTGDEVLEEWTKKVAEEHKSHWYSQLCSDVKHEDAAHVFSSLLSSRMQAAEAELLYIKEVEKLDGFGQETFPAKVGR